jgi:hypothetical protein
MKRRIIFGATYILIAWAATSCTALSDCKFCKTVTTDSVTGQVTEGSETEYCGAKLIAIETQTPDVTGTLTTRYKCR